MQNSVKLMGFYLFMKIYNLNVIFNIEEGFVKFAELNIIKVELNWSEGNLDYSNFSVQKLYSKKGVTQEEKWEEKKVREKKFLINQNWLEK